MAWNRVIEQATQIKLQNNAIGKLCQKRRFHRFKRNFQALQWASDVWKVNSTCILTWFLNETNSKYGKQVSSCGLIVSYSWTSPSIARPCLQATNLFRKNAKFRTALWNCNSKLWEQMSSICRRRLNGRNKNICRNYIKLITPLSVRL